ncbi:hypothetical protein EW146_g5645 [Bondarzewia mesenterica]|uniref:Uncharacterized protein n=1 Tax=Bondarzewia mesenterica TaxID=1095465 RepID=A0A4S4LQV6_9AGAM|nr:hypothetical protein EW146_g5645 [Bondarzewia mesenterica]
MRRFPTTFTLPHPSSSPTLIRHLHQRFFMASTGDRLPTGLPRTIHKDVLTVPGASPASKALVERLLERDREEAHCFHGPGFHNHLSHHLLAAYDLGAPPALLQAAYDDGRRGLLPIFTSDRPKRTVERQNVHIGAENWTQFLGQEKYYANYLSFFSEEVKRLGGKGAYEYYIFSEDANAFKAYMLERFVGGAVHPLIQMGYAIEFGSDAMVAQALAITAVHNAHEPRVFSWNAHESSAAKTDDSDSTHGGYTLLSIFREAYTSDVMIPVLPYDPDALLSKRTKEALTPARIVEIRRLTSLWSITPTLTPAQLSQKVEELFFLATLLFAGVGKKGRKERLDFFLMHVLTSSVFVPTLVNALESGEARARLLGAFLPVTLGYLLVRGRPRIDCELIMSYTASPRPP